MHVTVRLFAALRERAGTGRRELELPEGSRVSDVWPALDLGAEPGGLAYARNRAYADRDTPLQPGDEVAVIPPVSGGAAGTEPVVWAALTDGQIELQPLVDRVSDPGAGAVASFLGVVREHSRGREVEWLDYEAFHEMAGPEMEAIAAEATRRHGCLRAAVLHRTGRVEIGEASVAIAVSAAHRAAALSACTEIIDTLKVRVPIWKKERYAGGEEWIGQGS
jgi:molybdopterin synthase catalytic subunit/molybdopterin converting factor small subunit